MRPGGQLAIKVPFAIVIGIVLVASASCGGESDDDATGPRASRSAETVAVLSRTVSCRSGDFEVEFVQRERVSVNSAGRSLASASYTERRINPSCAPAQPSRRSSDAELGGGVYGDIDLACRGPARIEIDVHPIRDGDRGGKIAGSSLSVSLLSAERPVVIVAAVLKNREHAQVASRLYYARRYCRRLTGS